MIRKRRDRSHRGFWAGLSGGLLMGITLSRIVTYYEEKQVPLPTGQEQEGRANRDGNTTKLNEHSPGHYIANGSLYGNIHLSSDFTEDGMLKIPAGVNRIWIEIGANSRDLAQTIVNRQPEKDVMLLTFEPLVDKYGFIASLNTKPDTRRRVGHQSSDGRMLVFPFAVSQNSGVATFNVADVDGCSSLLPMRGGDNYKAQKEGWQQFINRCATTQEKRQVPTIAFTEILDGWLNGADVEWVKIDAQGFDVQLVQAAGEFTKQLKKVSMETTKDSCDVMYEGALRCSDMYRIMTELGFASDLTCDTAQWNGNGGCESEQFHWWRK